MRKTQARISPSSFTQNLVEKYDLHKEKEDFFPEFILTLETMQFQDFFVANQEKFSSQSLLFALEKTYALLFDSPRQLSSEEEAFLRECSSGLVLKIEEKLEVFSQQELEKYLQLCAQNDFDSQKLITELFRRSTGFPLDPTLLLYLIKNSQSKQFTQKIKSLFRSEFEGEKTIFVKEPREVIFAFRVFLLFHTDLDLAFKIENTIKLVQNQLDNVQRFEILEIYSQTKLKLPDMDLLDSISLPLSDSVSSMTLGQILTLTTCLD